MKKVNRNQLNLGGRNNNMSINKLGILGLLGALTLLFVLTEGVEATPFSNLNTITIPGSGTAGSANPYPSIINVSGLIGTITDVNVIINGLNHTSPDNIDILLVGPNGEKIILMSDAGGPHDVTDMNITFDDSASSNLPNGSALISGSFKPTNHNGNGGPDDSFPAPAPAGTYGSLLSIFDGTAPNGDWRLFVFDDQGVSNDPGSGRMANGWSLDINTAVAEPSTLVLFGAGLLGLAARTRKNKL
jgi:subtilisin-like proprotein convertase family protein